MGCTIEENRITVTLVDTGYQSLFMQCTYVTNSFDASFPSRFVNCLERHNQTQYFFRS